MCCIWVDRWVAVWLDGQVDYLRAHLRLLTDPLKLGAAQLRCSAGGAKCDTNVTLTYVLRSKGDFIKQNIILPSS